MTTTKFRNKTHSWRLDYDKNHPLTLKLRRKRYWKDACGHPDETYIGSAWFIDYSSGISGARERCIDVYVFNGGVLESQSVCIRCSDECSDYISPGSVVDLLITSQKRLQNMDGKYVYSDEAYAAAACVINHYMEIRATLRHETTLQTHAHQ